MDPNDNDKITNAVDNKALVEVASRPHKHWRDEIQRHLMMPGHCADRTEVSAWNVLMP